MPESWLSRHLRKPFFSEFHYIKKDWLLRRMSSISLFLPLKSSSLKKRVVGIDVARAFAIIGMIIVNFKIVFGEDGWTELQWVVGMLEGKASATFVFLAGVGLALMTNTAIQNHDQIKLNNARKRIFKRALFLFLLGVSYLTIWPADILHFYGVYMVITALLIKQEPTNILISAIACIAIFPVLMTIWNYETRWNFKTFEYSDMWTVQGFTRHLFFNGFHPVIPWVAFMLFGYWFGKHDLHNERFIKNAFYISLVSCLSIQVLSYAATSHLLGSSEVFRELALITGTSPMPPLPVYMLNGSAVACLVLSSSLLISNNLWLHDVIGALSKTGQLSLTIYVAHVILGMGIIEAVNPQKMGDYPIEFSVIYALLFSLSCIIFAIVWRKYKAYGPLEWIMRKITD